MKQTKTHCDTCGTEIEKSHESDKGSLKLVGRVSKSQTRIDQIMWDDLCHTCTSELFSVLNKFKRAKKMKTRRCAVCGHVKEVNRFGKGICIPKTTCLACKQRMLGFVEVKTIMFVKRTTRGV